MADATTAGQTIAPAGIGFAVAGGTVGGSLAGGNGKTQANLADGGNARRGDRSGGNVVGAQPEHHV